RTRAASIVRVLVAVERKRECAAPDLPALCRAADCGPGRAVLYADHHTRGLRTRRCRSAARPGARLRPPDAGACCVYCPAISGAPDRPERSEPSLGRAPLWPSL